MTSEAPTPLETEIHDRIARDGPLPVNEFMDLCLYDPGYGYYNRRPAFGVAGDFITAPEISQMFGELLGLWAATVWHALGEPDPVMLIELGPGRGTMMADALRAMRAAPEFRKAVRVHLVETSLDMQMRQRQTLAGVDDVMLRWHMALEEVPAGPAIILANEFFDALPVHQAERLDTGWHERAVTVNAGGELALTIIAVPLADFEPRLPQALRRAAIGDIFEWRADRFAVEIARRVAEQGAALVVDYGSSQEHGRRHIPSGCDRIALCRAPRLAGIDRPHRARRFRGAGQRRAGGRRTHSRADRTAYPFETARHRGAGNLAAGASGRGETADHCGGARTVDRNRARRHGNAFQGHGHFRRRNCGRLPGFEQ